MNRKMLVDFLNCQEYEYKNEFAKRMADFINDTMEGDERCSYCDMERCDEFMDCKYGLYCNLIFNMFEKE